MSSHAVLSSLYGLSRWYAAKRRPPAEILCEMRQSTIGTDVPPAGIPATDRTPAPINDRFTRSSVREVPRNRPTIRAPIPSRTARDACSMLCRSRSSEWSTDENSRFRATRFDRRRRRTSERSTSKLIVQVAHPRLQARRYTAGSPIASPSAPAEWSRTRRSLLAWPLTRLRISSCDRFGQMAVRVESEVAQAHARCRPGLPGLPGRTASRARASSRRSRSRGARSRKSAGRSRRQARHIWRRRSRE